MRNIVRIISKILLVTMGGVFGFVTPITSWGDSNELIAKEPNNIVGDITKNTKEKIVSDKLSSKNKDVIGNTKKTSSETKESTTKNNPKNLNAGYTTQIQDNDFSVIDVTTNQENTFKYHIAVNDLNRLSFPFNDVVVNTITNAEITNENGIVYILPKNSKPFVLFVSPSDFIKLAFKIVLIPKVMEPQSINVDIKEQVLKDYEKVYLLDYEHLKKGSRKVNSNLSKDSSNVLTNSLTSNEAFSNTNANIKRQFSTTVNFSQQFSKIWDFILANFYQYENIVFGNKNKLYREQLTEDNQLFLPSSTILKQRQDSDKVIALMRQLFKKQNFSNTIILDDKELSVWDNKKLCKNSNFQMSSKVVFGVKEQSLIYLLVRLENSSSTFQKISCKTKNIIGFSSLNSDVIKPNHSKYILVLHHEL